MSHIFISHSSQDNAAAAEMKTWLEAQGYTSLFLDFDPEHGIKAGSDWEQVLYRELRRCQAVIVLLTPNWLTSKWCFAEVMQAREKGKAILVAKVQPCDDRSILPDLQHVDLTSAGVEGYQRLAEGLKAKGLDPADTFDWDAQRSPYPGLQNFDEKDAAIFFGRDAETFASLEMLNSLRRKGAESPRFVLFLGASGSGKSSLVRAGVLPRLRKDPDHWLPLRPFRPQNEPIDGLAVVLAGAFKNAGEPSDWQALRQTLQNAAAQDPPDARVLATLLRELLVVTNCPDATILMVIDQAEELVGYSASAAAERFLTFVRAALALTHRQLIVVATLRSDFLGAFQTHSALAGFDYASVTVDPMLTENIPQIIEHPAALAGVRLEQGLVPAILQEASTRDVLPLLAFTLRRLYDQGSRDGLLAISEYRALGGLEASVRQAADQVIQATPANSAELESLRHAFIPNMVRIKEDGQYARRLAYQEQLPELAKALLHQFVDARLLVSGRDQEGRATLEVAHEALLRTWPTLMDWLKEDEYRLRLVESVCRGAQEWQGGHRGAELLIHRGGRLSEVQLLLAEERFAGMWNALEKEYLDACMRLEQQQERLKKRRTRLTIGALTVVLGVVSILATLTFRSSQIAEAERDKAEKGRINAEIFTDILEAENLLALRLPLDALSKALNIGYDIHQKAGVIDHSTRMRLTGTLQRILYDQSTDINLFRTPSRLANQVENAIDVRSSPDARLLALIQNDNTVHLLNTNGELTAIMGGHRDRINDVKFSPDGQTVATASQDGSIKLWTQSGNLLTTLAGHRDGVNRVSFSPDGQTVATASSDDTAMLWRLDGTPLQTLAGHRGNVYDVRFSPDGTIIATASGDQSIRLWNTSGVPLNVLDHGSEVWQIGFSPDGQQLVSVGDWQLSLWRIDGTSLQTLATDSYAGLASISTSSDGGLLAVTDISGSGIKIYNINNELTLLYTLDSVSESKISFSSDGNTLATLSPFREDIQGNRRLNLFIFDLDRLLADGCQGLNKIIKESVPVAERISPCQPLQS